jgi:uncharacterized protein YdiU (UPF0061 family)
MLRPMSRGAPIAWNLEASYAALPEAFWAPAEPARFPQPELVVWNGALAEQLGLTGESRDELAQFATGQSLPPGAVPIAQAYAGHQYGHATMLGDGRAILAGERRTASGALVDIQWKGAGQTRFSRRGDGRATLGAMLREYLVSESLDALGIPTTRSLAVATTGERITRETARVGAVLVRTASSHLRVGTFEYAAALGDVALLRTLADYAIARHDPDLAHGPDRFARFLDRVVARQAALVARWQCVGFVHGVMNTDNMTISGESIDFGPCAFMDAYDPDTVFSSIDRFGRYRYREQPRIAHWNLARFAESLVAVLDDDRDRAIDLANEILGRFPERFACAWLDGMRAKLGLSQDVRTPDAARDDADRALVEELLAWMHAARADFTNTFRALSEVQGAGQWPSSGLPLDARLESWLARWRERLAAERAGVDELARRMRLANPALIPRNHRVEEVLAAAEHAGDLAPFTTLATALRRPFEPHAGDAPLREPAPSEFCGYRTFCGT